MAQAQKQLNQVDVPRGDFKRGIYMSSSHKSLKTSPPLPDFSIALFTLSEESRTYQNVGQIDLRSFSKYKFPKKCEEAFIHQHLSANLFHQCASFLTPGSKPSVQTMQFDEEAGWRREGGREGKKAKSSEREQMLPEMKRFKIVYEGQNFGVTEGYLPSVWKVS